MNLKRVGRSCAGMWLGLCLLASAEMPRLFYFEDCCADSNGVPYSGYLNLQLQLYPAATGGTCLYEDARVVFFTNGFVATAIGDDTVSGSLSNALAGGEAYVQVIVDGDALSPREPLVPVPYALQAASVGSNAISSAMIGPGAVQGDHVADGAIAAGKLASDVDDRYVNASGDALEGDFSLAGSLIFLPTTECVLSPGFQSDGDVTIHWMTESGTYFKYGETASGGDRFHFGSDGSFQAWGDIYSQNGIITDGGLSVYGGASVSGDLAVGDHFTVAASNGAVAARSMRLGSVVLGGTSNALVMPNIADSASGAVRIGVDEGTLFGDWDLEGRGSVRYEPEIGTNQYALWVRNFGATTNDARGLLVTTPEYSDGEGIIFHAASKAGASMASRFIVETDGDVGVGVNDPQSKFHVAGNARVSGDLLIPHGQNIMPPNFQPVAWGAEGVWGPDAYLNLGFIRELHVAENAYFPHKVRIGTSDDSARLNVSAPALLNPTYAARFTSAEEADSDQARGVLVNFPNNTNGGAILFHAMSGAGPYTNSRFVVKADGKVGIGTAYPEATLHVNGNVRFDGVVQADGSGLTNLPVTGWTTNEADARFVRTTGDNLVVGSLKVDNGTDNLIEIGVHEGITIGDLTITDEGVFHPEGTSVYMDKIRFSGANDSGQIIMGEETNVIVGTRQLKGDWTVDGNLGVDGSASGTAFTAESFALARTGAASMVLGFDTNWPDYPVIRSGNSEIYFGIPGDPSLWFNFGMGTNIYFGDSGNRQHVQLFGDLHVDGTIHGDGSGLVNLPVTGLATNQADSRYVNTAGDVMTGSLSLIGPSEQTNLTVAGWAKIDYIVPQGGLSMGSFTNGLPSF